MPKLTPGYSPGLGHDAPQNFIKTFEVVRADRCKMGQYLGIHFLFFISSVDM